MSCYSPEAQTEMICYGILNVIVPTKIGKLKDIPEVIRLSGLARRAEPVAANVARSSERAAVDTGERIRPRTSTPTRTPTPNPAPPRPRVASRRPSPAAGTLRAAATGEEVANAVAHTETSGARKAGTDAAGTTERTAADAATRSRFTDKFVNKTYTTETQNQAWVDLATSSETSAGTRFFDVENSAMKRLNDTTLDKNFVTALTNQHKEILARRMEELARRYPTVEFAPYSDFKSMRYALRPKPPATSLPSGLQQDLARTFTAANSEFVSSLERQHLIPRGENASNWFRSGFGESADEASLASRYARSAAGSNQMHTFADSSLQQRLDDMRRLSESSRSRLQEELSGTSLMEASGVPGKSIPRREVFDGVRKTQTNEQLIDFIKKTTGETITDAQATEIRAYAGLVDEFSPGIHIVRREVASLADSRAGGLSIDFAGLGSFNGQATASALARSDSIQTAVRETRLGERGVTDLFLERKRQVQSSIQTVLRRHGISAEIVASGDDMVVKPSRPIPADVRQEITDELARQIDPSSIRMSHVGGDISSGSERMMMATIGEACEKMIRKLARAAIAPARLNQILILVEVSGSSSANFGGHVVLGAGQSAVSSAERAVIQSAADQALRVRCR